jgi:hypothetical protein
MYFSNGIICQSRACGFRANRSGNVYSVSQASKNPPMRRSADSNHGAGDLEQPQRTEQRIAQPAGENRRIESLFITPGSMVASFCRIATIADQIS